MNKEQNKANPLAQTLLSPPPNYSSSSRHHINILFFLKVVLCGQRNIITKPFVNAPLAHTTNIFIKEETMKKFSMFGLLCAIIAATSIFSCRQTAKGNETPKPVKIASISVKPTITLKKGETSTLKATILPKEAPQEVKWESDKPAIVSVDEKGVITAKEVGSANIKVTSLKDATKTATCAVTVAETYVAVTEIKLPTTTALKKGDTSELNFKVLPKNATDKNVECTSDAPDKVSVDENIINVDEDGNGKVKITAKEVGEATITVSCKTKSEDGREKVVDAKCKVTVTEAEVALTELKIDPTAELRKYDTKELKVTFIPDNTSNINRGVEWKIDKPAIVSVEEIGDGKVKITAKEVGTANIKVTSTKDSTKTATCKVTVIPPVPVESVSLDKDVLELAYENSETLIATVKPDTASQEVIWSSSDETVATCSPGGVVTAKKHEGKITITATSKTDPSKKATCTVYVAKEKIKSLSFDENPIEMEINTSKKFKVNIQPDYASHWMDYEVKAGSAVKVVGLWHQSTDYNRVEVRAGDLPSNLKEKEEKITFWSKARPDLKAVLTVKVVRPKVTKITVQNKKIGLTDYTHKMEAIVFPQKAWQEVKWESKDKSVVKIDEEGVLDPKGPGTATIVATATDGSGVKAEATVTVKTASYGVGIDKSAIYYGGGEATLTITKSQAGSTLDYNFEMESDKPSDLDIKRVSELVFKIKVKNKKARTAEAKLTIKSRNFSDATRYAYINIKTIIPEAISIKGDDKMYLNEELQFNIDTTKKDSSHPEPDKKVRWEWDNSYSTSGIGAGDFEIKQDGKVRLRSPSSDKAGKTFKIKAILDLDSSVVATKVIKLYLNVAKPNSFPMLSASEYTMCNPEDEESYNTPSQLNRFVTVDIDNLNEAYNKFVISEYADPKDIPTSKYFTETVRKIEVINGERAIRLADAKDHTSSEQVKFYVWPVDPKTEKPILIPQDDNTFYFRIWAKPEGIEIVDCSFSYHDFTHEKYGEGLQSEMFNSKHTGTKQYFHVGVLPKHANPNLLVWDHIPEGYAGSPLVGNRLDKSDNINSDGRWRFDFKLQKAAPAWRKKGNILFGLSANGPYTGDEKIKTYIQIIKDSGL